MKDVGVEDASVEERRRVAEDRLHVPAEDPEIEKRIARPRRRAEERGGMEDERPGRDDRRGKVHKQRPQPATHGQPCSSSRFSSWLASFGLALPPLPFITWPTRNPNVWCLPARYCAAASALFAMTSRTIASNAPSSLFCASP